MKINVTDGGLIRNIEIFISLFAISSDSATV